MKPHILAPAPTIVSSDIPWIVEAAKLSSAIYSESEENLGMTLLDRQGVNLYRLANPTASSVFRKNSVVWIAFRGTIPKETGNWLFANFQFYKTKFTSCPIQDGMTHWGFYRNFYWLWSKDRAHAEIEKDHRQNRDRKFWWRLLGFWIPLVLCALLLPSELLPSEIVQSLGWWIQLPGWLFASGILFTVLFEAGMIEKAAFLRNPKPEGLPIEDLLQKHVKKEDTVIFTGHSLGGAMAVHAFNAFQNNFQDNEARLATFGAPRIADLEWISAFEARHKKRKCYHFANWGDPVPHLPCDLEHAKTCAEEFGRIELCLLAIGWIRTVWSRLYGQEPPAAWSQIHHVGVRGALEANMHEMAIYETEIEKLQKKEFSP